MSENYYCLIYKVPDNDAKKLITKILVIKYCTNGDYCSQLINI